MKASHGCLLFNLKIQLIMANLDINVLYAKYENLKESFSAEVILEEFVQEMTSNQLQELLEGTCKSFDVDFDLL